MSKSERNNRSSEDEKDSRKRNEVKSGIEDAWKEFTKDSEYALKEIEDAFRPDNSNWSFGRICIIVVGTFSAAILIKYLFF